MSMGIEDFIGAPSSKEAGGFFDPLGLSVGKDDETLTWCVALVALQLCV